MSWLRLSARGRPGKCNTQSGMGTVQVRIWVDHFRLDPQAELHAQPTNFIRQGAQTIGENIAAHRPIAQPRVVVAACAEPAVIDDEKLHANRCRHPRQGGLVFHGKIEVGCLPTVVEHGAELAGRPMRQHPFAGETVHPPARAAKALRAAAEDERGRRVCFARFQAQCEIGGLVSRQDAVRARRQRLETQPPVAAPGNSPEEHGPRFLRHLPARVDKEKRVGRVARVQRTLVERERALSKQMADRDELAHARSGGMRQFVRTGGQVAARRSRRLRFRRVHRCGCRSRPSVR